MKVPSGSEKILSPALLFDVDIIEKNLQTMIAMVGGNTALLRPHIKTHKCGEILKLQRARGIDSIKCATLAEARLAAENGVPDILLSYPLVGPAAKAFAKLQKKFPASRFSSLVDSGIGLDSFLGAFRPDSPVSLFLDLDCGMHRTGIDPGPEAMDLIRLIVESPACRFAGIHAYDGHIHDAGIATRSGRFAEAMSFLDGFIEVLESTGISVPLIVSGGSPTFPMHAAKASESGRPWQCSPGTPVLWDAGYDEHYSEMDFAPAAFLLTRVVSHPGENRVCVDLGHKAVSAENPIENRVRFPGHPDISCIGQSEEHLVLGVNDTSDYPIGTELIGIPYHVCPTVALHGKATLIKNGKAKRKAWKISRGR